MPFHKWETDKMELPFPKIVAVLAEEKRKRFAAILIIPKY